MSEISNAWLMEASGGHKFAIAEYEMIEYVITPELISIPLTPNYCSSIMLWSERMIPVVNFGLLLGNQDSVTHSVSVLAYQDMPGEDLKYLGISQQQAPVKITVCDDQACALTEYNQDFWQALSASCFKHDDEVIPIINLAILGSPEFSQKAKEFSAGIEPFYMQAELANI
ncbi:MAG: hypothetical protein ACN4GM_15080 [Gammaproteobacteria bacterium]